MPYRILVRDKDEAVDWYQKHLGFEVLEEWGPAFAILSKGTDVMWVSGPQTSAAKPLEDGSQPVPAGGWNRIVVEVENVETTLTQLDQAGAKVRNRPVAGPGGTQVLIEDPSGNLVEIFEQRA